MKNFMIIEELKNFSGPEFNEFLKIYSSSFPLVELKPIEKVVNMLKNDANYHLYVVKERDTVVAFSLLYLFPALKISLLDYMAVAIDYQRKKIGTRLFEFTVAKARSKISDSIGMLIEIQREDGTDPEERQTRTDRIRFYSRLGAKVLQGVHYLLPPQHGTEPEDTYLMIVPFMKIHSITKNTLLQYIKNIYTTIYQYTNNDLISYTEKTLPHRTIFS